MELKAEKGKYRKKPVVVDAAEWLCKGDCPVWAQHAVREWHTFFQVTTPEGVMRGDPGDWIIRGAKGEIYLCKADIFAAMYEPAAAEEQPEPVAWFEAEGSARGLSLREVLPSLVHSTRWHYQAERPKTTNPVWPVFAAAPTPPAGTVFGIPAAHALLEWNRLQSEPPIKIGREYDVAKAYVAMMAPARDAGQEQMEAALRTIAEWPVTPAGNMDAENMRRVAGSALAAATAPGAPGREAEQPAAQAAGLTSDAVAREQIEGWARRAGIIGSGADGALTESNLVRLGDFAIAAREALLSRAEREAAGLRQMLDAERQRASNAVAVSNALQDKLSRAAPQSSEQQANPCPGCVPGGVRKTPTCGRLQTREAERSRGKPVSQLVAECEADPQRKAALDRARERVAEQSPIHPEHMALLQSIASRLDGRLPRDVVGYIKKRYGTERADRDEIQALIDAAVNLVKVSGRYHSEIAYRRLATAANEYAAACREQMERANGR
ncbi:PGDYG domain-containing protein [Cupriavidus gilardii]|uniref:PGDYG domain-containing protein n=1 Tax=Cupriavidus gilardii TaxID=82541 RepID=UPI0021B395A0|nr:PGDYG domain-containing protein [Cupriavidus gilardii]UXC37339.1 PGDYG domain-containing protein [Cupriavidus gilardii]